MKCMEILKVLDQMNFISINLVRLIQHQKSADYIIRSYIRTYKLKAVISNCCNNYGPYQFPEKIIPKMISNIFNNKELPIYAKGQNSREWIHVFDHCEALFALYLKGKNNESYNVGSGKI